MLENFTHCDTGPFCGNFIIKKIYFPQTLQTNFVISAIKNSQLRR